MGDGTHLYRFLSWIHLEMKIFLLIYLASGLASSEKLDRTYLPPPGSKFSGGSPGDIQVPLEFPKETYTVQPPGGKPDIELGINRRPPGLPESQKPGFTYFQKSYPVPKTTTSYAITQTTTFAPADDYEGLDQSTGFINGSTGIQSGLPGQSYQQPIRGPGQGPSFNQYRPGQGQPSTIAPYGTTARPLFPGTQKGLEYLPPVPASNNRGQSPSQVVTNQNSFGYQSGRPLGPKYQDGQSAFPGQTINQPSLTQESNQKTQYTGSQNIPTSIQPQYQDAQDGRFGPTGPGSQQTQFPSSTAVPQYQTGQRFTPGSNQQNQFSVNQNFPSSTAVPQYQTGQRFTTPGINQQVFGARVPSQQNQYNRNQYQGNGIFPSSTPSPTPGSIQQGLPSTAAPNYQNGRFTTPGQIQGGFVPNQQSQNQYVGNENFSSTTAAPQFQGGERFSTPGYEQQGIGNQNVPSSTAAPQYQNGQQFTTAGPIQQNRYPGNQNFQSTAAPSYQDGQRVSTTSQFVPGQQSFGSRIPSQQSQNQFTGNQNFPSSTSSPQYQDSQQFTTPGSRIPVQQNQNQYAGNQNLPSSTITPQYQDIQRFTTPGSRLPGQQTQNAYEGNQNYPSSTAAPQYQDSQSFTTLGSQTPNQQSQYQYSGNQNFPSSTSAPQYQDGQRFTTPGPQGVGSLQQNRYPGSQSFPTSTTAPQFQDERFSTPGRPGIPNQPSYPGSTFAPEYQQTLRPGINQPGFISGQQNQYQQLTYNQQRPSSTGAPQKFIPGSQAYSNDGIQTTPGTAVSFLTPQGDLPSIYGNTQPPSQFGTGPPSYGTASSKPPGIFNQGFPSTTAGPQAQPARDIPSAPGFGNIVQSRPERPQAGSDRNAEILSYENVLTPEGYSYSYDTSNGIHADETGTVGNGTRAQGGFSYTGDDGKVYSVFYSADENGFQPQGDHLPTSPPIPEAIQRVIDQANKDKESGIEDDGSYNDEKYGFMKYEGPLTKLRPRNRTMSPVNGVDLPDLSQNRFGSQKNKLVKPKGRKPTSGRYSEVDGSEEFESEPETEIGEAETNEAERGGDDNEYVRPIGTKRPKPIKNLTVEGNRPHRFRENKTPMKAETSSKSDSTQNMKSFDGNSPGRRPVLSEEDETGVRDDVSISDITDEQTEDVESATEESQEFDYESDLVNYKDDPNNRTDFHGLNKYLPKPKGNRKKQPGKKRPNVQVDGAQKAVGVNEPDRFGNDYNQVTQENESDFIDGTRTRIPSRLNNIKQKTKGKSRVNGRPVSSDNGDEIDTYDDSRVDTEDNDFDENSRLSPDRINKPGNLQSKKKTPVKPKRPNLNDGTSISENGIIKPSLDEETGYEYTPPQRKFEMGGNLDFPSRTTISGKPAFLAPSGSQTTLRPFMTKNVYGDDDEFVDEDIDENGDVKPDRGRPSVGQKQQYPGIKNDGDKYNENPNPEMNQGQRFSTTRKPEDYGTSSRRPFGRPQTSSAPQYEGQRVTQERYNEPATIQGSQRPGGKVFYNTNAPTRGTSGDVFSSSTPLPSSGPNSVNQYQRPGPYQGRPIDTSVSYGETSSPSEETYIRPGANELVPGQVPSTTYRPNYSFGDRTLAPNGPISVDGFGRPIPNTNAPVFDRTLSPMYSTARPTTGQGSMRDWFKPTAGRFGVTSATQGTPGYQSSTTAPEGEDFSGPKQPQRFDPESGYYYK